MSIEIIKTESGYTAMNTDDCYIFTSYTCSNCPHKCGRTCTATFTARDSDFDVFDAPDGVPYRAAYKFYNRGDEFVACASVCNAHGVQPIDFDDYSYTDDYIYCESDGDYYSLDYAENELYYCRECDQWYNYSDWNSEHEMCNECAANRYDGLIGEWHDHKREFTPYGGNFGDCLIGHEIEIDDGDIYNSDMAEMINDVFPRHFVFENDCSLRSGFEVISQPHTLAAFDALDWEKFCRMCVNNGYRAHDTTTCGLHMHFSTNWFGVTDSEQRETLARVLRWYDANFGTMLTLSRRGDNYDSYAENNRTGHRWEYLDDESNNDALVSRSIDGSRYVAVNCSNFYRYSTIEFRLGRGTLKASTLRWWTDLHVGIIRACREHVAPSLSMVLNYCEHVAETSDGVRARLLNA